MGLTVLQGDSCGTLVVTALCTLAHLFTQTHIYGGPSKSRAWGYSSEQDRCGPCLPEACILCYLGLVLKAGAGNPPSPIHPRRLGPALIQLYRVLIAAPHP